jgi:hypothetical protein
MDIRDEGKISEWNEGNLKSIRLHEAQEMINYAKDNKLKQLSDSRWGYLAWISGIDILYGEGCSKYSQKEIDEIELIKHVIELALKYRNPHKLILCGGIGKSKKDYILNERDWENLQKIIVIYEQKVKYFNELHGLSTRNYSEDWKGL